MLKNENNKQTVEASKRRFHDECFFSSYRSESHSVRPYCWQWRIEHRASGMYQLRELKQRRGRRQREWQKSNRFRLKKQQLCTCITLFCTFLCRRCIITTTTWWCVISRFVKDGNTRQQLSLSFPELWYSPLEFNSKKLALTNVWRIKGDEISAIKFEAAQIHFSSNVFVAVAVVVA